MGFETRDLLTQRANGSEYRKKLEMMAQAHGAAVPAKLDLERQILSRVERLPGGSTPSKRLGLQIMTGDIDRFGFEDYLNMETMSSEAPRLDTHTIMEDKLKLGPGSGRFTGSTR
jgi:proteasome maturation protein